MNRSLHHFFKRSVFPAYCMPDTLLILLDILKLHDGGIVIAAAMEMYTIYRVQGDSSPLGGGGIQTGSVWMGRGSL